MCDRAVPQQNLCAELAGLLGSLPCSSSPDAKNGSEGGEFAAVTSWLAAFWEILAREWTAIDVLRLEKFLLLVRRVLGASLEWAAPTADRTKKAKKGKKGGKGRQEALLAVLRDWPLDPTGDLSKMPVGLRLHVLDIWVDEVEKAGFLPPADDEKADDDDDDEDDEAFLTCLRALVETQLRSPSKPVRARARESLADDRLPWNRGRGGDDESAGDEDGEDDGWAGFRD